MKINTYKKFIAIYKIAKEIVTFGNFEVEKHKFHQHKSPSSIYDVNFDRIVVSNRFSFGKKGFEYFIKYKDGKKVRPLCIMLPKNECI